MAQPKPSHLRQPVVYAWATRSSRGTTTYETVLYRNGALSCDCPGWTFVRGETRSCKHTRQYAGQAKTFIEQLDAGRTITVPQTPSYPLATPLSPLRATSAEFATPRKRRAITFLD